MKFTVAFVMIMLLSGCNKVQFEPGTPEAIDSFANLPQTSTPDSSSPVSSTPLIPEMPSSSMPEPIPTPVLPPQLKTGTCMNQDSLTSCLKCELNIQQPLISSKAQKLARIMSMACPIYNKSYPSDYVSPSTDQIWQHVLACNSQVYPETNISGAQLTAIDELLNIENDSLRQKLFKGLWYQRPYSDHFELYFGLENKEAALVFCLNQSISGPLITSEYAAVMSSEQFWNWQNDPAAQARWNAAQVQRQQLLSCLNKPTSNPINKQPVCDYKSFQGDFQQNGQEFISSMLLAGYKVAVETKNSCVEINSVPAKNDPQFLGIVKIAGYRCI